MKSSLSAWHGCLQSSLYLFKKSKYMISRVSFATCAETYINFIFVSSTITNYKSNALNNLFIDNSCSDHFKLFK